MSIGNGHSLFCECEACIGEEPMTAKSQTDTVAQTVSMREALQFALNELSYIAGRHGYVSTETAIIRVKDALAAQPPADDRRATEDMTLAHNVRQATIEECARVAEMYSSGPGAAGKIRELAAQPPAAPVDGDAGCGKAVIEPWAVEQPRPQSSADAPVEPVLSGLQEDLILMSFHNAPDAPARSSAGNESDDRLRDAVQLLIDYIGDGCPEGAYSYCMSEARAAIKGISVVPTKAQPPIPDDRRATEDMTLAHNVRQATIEECARVAEMYSSGPGAAGKIRELAAQPPAAPVETDEQPVAYAVFTDSGNIRLWSKTKVEIETWAKGKDKVVTPLYMRPAPVPRSSADSEAAALNDRRLMQQLREMATQFAIENKTDCKQHVCWIAAERLAALMSGITNIT